MFQPARSTLFSAPAPVAAPPAASCAGDLYAARLRGTGPSLRSQPAAEVSVVSGPCLGDPSERLSLSLLKPWSAALFLTVGGAALRSLCVQKVYDLDGDGEGAEVGLSADARRVVNDDARGRLVVGVAASEGASAPWGVFPMEWRWGWKLEDGSRRGGRPDRQPDFLMGLAACFERRGLGKIGQQVAQQLAQIRLPDSFQAIPRAGRETGRGVAELRETVWEGAGSALPQGQRWVEQRSTEFCCALGALLYDFETDMDVEPVWMGESSMRKRRREREQKEKRRGTEREAILKRRRTGEMIQAKVMRVADDAERQNALAVAHSQAMKRRQLERTSTPSPRVTDHLTRGHNRVRPGQYSDARRKSLPASLNSPRNGYELTNGYAPHPPHRAKAVSQDGAVQRRRSEPIMRASEPMTNGNALKRVTPDLSTIPDYFLGGSDSDSDHSLLDVYDLSDIGEEIKLPRPARSSQMPVTTGKKPGPKSRPRKSKSPPAKSLPAKTLPAKSPPAKSSQAKTSGQLIPNGKAGPGRTVKRRKRGPGVGVKSDLVGPAPLAGTPAVNEIIERIGRSMQDGVPRVSHAAEKDEFQCESSPSLTSSDEEDKKTLQTKIQVEPRLRRGPGRPRRTSPGAEAKGPKALRTLRVEKTLKTERALKTESAPKADRTPQGPRRSSKDPAGNAAHCNPPSSSSDPESDDDSQATMPDRSLQPARPLHLGEHLNAMNDAKRELIAQWKRGDFSGFEPGKKKKEITLNSTRYNCTTCFISVTSCEESIVLELRRNNSWRKIRRLHHIGPALMKRMGQ